MRRRLLVAVVALAGCSSQPAVTPLRVSVKTGSLTDSVATAMPDGAGRVLTVAHVLDGARSVRVGGRVARVVRVDRGRDLAVLAVEGVRGAPASARGGAPVAIHVLRGGRAVVLPARLRRRVRATVSDTQGAVEGTRPALELGVSVLPGDSGAPVVDAHGRVVGMVFARGEDGDAWALDLAPA